VRAAAGKEDVRGGSKQAVLMPEINSAPSSLEATTCAVLADCADGYLATYWTVTVAIPASWSIRRNAEAVVVEVMVVAVIATSGWESGFKDVHLCQGLPTTTARLAAATCNSAETSTSPVMLVALWASKGKTMHIRIFVYIGNVLDRSR